MSPDHSALDQRSPQSPQFGVGTENPNGVVTELLREMRAHRDMLNLEHQRAAAERKSERRWKRLLQMLFFGGPLILGGLYFLFFLNSAGFRWGPWRDVVGVVRIEGEIAPSSTASADKIISALEKAFSNPSVKAVVLSIDSAGGAPVESERVYSALTLLRKKHAKPVVAVINSVGASAAYLIALHTDKIVAGKYSLVGGVGAMIASWDLSKAIGRVDVSQRVYTSGKLKSFMNPFSPVSQEAEAKAKQIVNQMGEAFLKELNSSRGKDT